MLRDGHLNGMDLLPHAQTATPAEYVAVCLGLSVTCVMALIGEEENRPLPPSGLESLPLMAFPGTDGF
jgi:hypothetical protein